MVPITFQVALSKRIESMVRMLMCLGLLLSGYVVNLSAPSDFHPILDLHSIRGGEDVYCAFPYPVPIGGCIGPCVAAGNMDMSPPGMPPMLVPVWRRCLTAQGDDKCWQNSMATTRCIKTDTPCPPAWRGIYTDAQCVAQVTTNFQNCGIQFVKATSGTQPGVSCTGIPNGIK